MFDTIFDLIHNPKSCTNWMAFFEVLLALAAVVAGVAAIVCCPALAPLGLLVALAGVAGMVFGHW
ncbi:MAG: hypothetical protein LUF28_04005 [Clostridiales bacterium]|nr:hypothetical protein [Clostridiales bacterium]